jgi:hypothetical protein
MALKPPLPVNIVARPVRIPAPSRKKMTVPISGPTTLITPNGFCAASR